ncbi:MAG: amylo-alpha-1,6-glucosidase [Hamadaea sp.]|uniref:amylo-alpha-1,6-glucosidase n=1 Tax=Hamadaea sp. TaxID=2024425 RepID=UPI0017AA1079|nr:amylo-alpha-1,6-glucosidase [Hamadaea sp.]NUT19152.1 amylo-alpha-1,6-glucosidase [Hamadaea sp.]
MTIRFGPQLCTDLYAGTQREWLVTDGLGGYAMGTVSGLRTRRYHGLLIMADPVDGPARRQLGLASLDATITLESGRAIKLGVHEWADGSVDPSGHELLAEFDLADGIPRWRWQIGSVVIEREIAMRHGEPSVAVVHRLVSGGPVDLTLSVLGTWRDVHGERTAQGPPPHTENIADGVVVEGAYRVRGEAEWRPKGEWWFGVRHREEAQRGLNPSEDLWHLGEYAGRLDRPGQSIGVTAAAPTTPDEPAEMTVRKARERGRRLGELRAADQFVVRTPNGPDVVAGYPWFGAWGRDTMISYEGLFLTTGRVDEGRQLLRNYAATLSEGMLANTCDTGSREYNTADATLWFLHAVDRHARLDPDLAEELRPQLRSVVDHHTWGTRYAIKMDPVDGLLSQGAEGAALTWMDARLDGVPVTQRAGKAVDINALWVNGLAGLARRWPEDGYRQLHDRARESFQAKFLREDGLLHDVLDRPEDGIRPNQLLAWSLPYAPLTPDEHVLRTLADALLTPLGLRSLSPGADAYRGHHRGTPEDRDRAYHQGTVWPWLLGPFRDATAKLDAAGRTDATAKVTAGRTDAARTDAGKGRQLAGSGIEAHRSEYGLGSVSETADGDAPHGATGCPFQAWSVAETTRTAETTWTAEAPRTAETTRAA